MRIAEGSVRALLALAVASMVAALILGPAAQPARGSTDVSSVAGKIICQCGCGAVLENCPHQECGWGIPAKQFIKEQLEAGRTSAELIEYYVSQNGEQILAAPEKQGFGLTAWVTPFAAILSAAAALYFLVRMWARERGAATEPAVVESNLPPEGLERLENELRTFD